jgi:fibronectin type 3 domain-containing protein
MLYQGVVIRRKFTVLAVLLVTLILKSFTASAANVTLAWDASPDPSVTGYRVYYGGASGTYTNSLQVGNVTTTTVSNLLLGATYYFAATAYDSAGTESDFSNERPTCRSRRRISRPP